MITVFNRSEIMITRDLSALNAARDTLSAAGIPYIIKTNGGVMTSGRERGIPLPHPNETVEYRVFVAKKDLDRANAAMNRR